MLTLSKALMYILYNPGVDKKLMSNNTKHNEKLGILQKFASLLGLITASLYFVGWVYRWQYYVFFQLEIITLNFSFQSFLFLPIQVFFGSIQAVLKTILAIVLIVVLIDLAIWFVEGLGCNLERDRIKQVDKKQPLKNKIFTHKKSKLLISKIWRSLAQLNPIKFDYLKFLISLTYQIVNFSPGADRDSTCVL